MTQQEFAKAIDVSPASLSNIFNGKTNPTNNHVSDIHRRFPDINCNWLMFGEGEMYTTVSDETNKEENGSSDRTGQVGKDRCEEAPTLFPSSEAGNAESASSSYGTDGQKANRPGEQSVPVVREVIKYIDKPERKIVEIRIFFDDGTFEVFS
ncbi:MAG: helix-turn-helix domain-containing protein [Paraprevotella sp.]|nr:helix-turn-helix domain-containing protein [Paraprevotella sp.]